MESTFKNSKIVINKERTMWKRGWYIATNEGARYLDPHLNWQIGVTSPFDCFCKTREEARKRLRQYKAALAKI